MDFLADLNPTQQEAVLHKDGPSLILAGAGSGKTRVLTYKTAYLAKSGVRAENLVLLTFTNKAADEMRERVIKLLGKKAEGLFAGTFHSLCARILRKHIQHLGFSNNFLIYDENDQRGLLKKIIKELNLPKKYAPATLLNVISDAKDKLVDPSELAQDAYSPFYEIAARVYSAYQKQLAKANALDFDDLLAFTIRLFKEQPKILGLYKSRFEYVLVDEYQDTNHAQYLLTKSLAEPQKNLTVVGDAAQAIYSWRGATIKNILEFKRDFPEAKVFNLEQNYRSTQTILDAGGAVIEGNRGAHPILKLWTENEKGEPLVIYQASDEEEEAEFVIKTLKNLSPPFQPSAVLYRMNAQSRVLEERLIQSGIPYRLIGGVKFYQRKEIQDVLSYLRLIYNPQDEQAKLRLLKLGKKKFAALSDKLPKFVRLKNPLKLMDKILEQTGYLKYLDDGTEEGLARIENVKELRSLASQFEDLTGFLEQVALVDYSNNYDPAFAKEDPKVALMTLHAAKGLEFPTVFIVGMEEGIFPHSRSLFEQSELEEERRLCYVGITRAMKKLYLTFAKNRLYFGARGYNLSSRFLKDIPRKITNWEQGLGKNFVFSYSDN